MLEAPREIGRYQLLGRLAVGGMAEIFRARVVGAHGFMKEVVIKRILPHLVTDPTFVNMFIDEAKLTARLVHPKIVQVIDFGEAGGQYFIAMELVDGTDCLGLLRACSARRARLPTELAVFLAQEMLDALDYAHGVADDSGTPLGIVHRDVSPSNILISKRGDVKLGDFGIARAAEQQTKTQAGTLKGKYGYMSPEQVVAGDVDARSDIFSAGIVLAEMLMGRRLFTAPNELDVLLMVRDVKLDRLAQHGSDIPPPLRAILDRALVREPTRRFQRAGEFRDALADYLFSLRRRMSPKDLSAFIDRVGAWHAATEAVPPPEGTLSGPNTMARHIQVEAERERARGIVEKQVAEGELASTQQPTTVARSEAAARVAAGPGDGDLLIDIAAEIELELAGAGAAEARVDVPQDVAPADGAPPPELPSGAPPEEPPSVVGDFGEISPLRAFSDLAIARETGLWLVECSAVAKEIFVIDGVPVFVSSNIAGELFGEYLVSRGALTEGELAMALAMMPHFSGKLGDALVGLNLMRPIEVFRHLTHQVREKLLDVFTWTNGRFAFYPGKLANRDMFPLGLDAYELMGAAGGALGDDRIREYLAAHALGQPRAVVPPRFPPERFRLGPAPRDLLDRLDGHRSVQDWQALFTVDEALLQFGRTLFVLVETQLAAL